MTRPVTLHIDRLVLDGLALTPAQGASVQRAMERELARLWTQDAAGAHARAIDAALVRTPPLAITAGRSLSPARIGRDAARSLFSMWRPA